MPTPDTDTPENGFFHSTFSPEQEAWLTAFFIENHLDPMTHPDHAATDEQVRFMVYHEGPERYYPCSDRMFQALMAPKRSRFLANRYAQVLGRIIDLIRQQVEAPAEAAYLEELIRTKFRHETRDRLMIPSRIEKRLMAIFLNRTQIEDPYRVQKMTANARAAACLSEPACRAALDTIARQDRWARTDSLRVNENHIHRLRFQRLFALAVTDMLWQGTGTPLPDATDYQQWCRRRFIGNGLTAFFKLIGLADTKERVSRRFLWLANESGEIMVDLHIIRHLIHLGHRVVLAVKHGSTFSKVDTGSCDMDPILETALKNAPILTAPRMRKNDLVQALRSDQPLMVMSDGTVEEINLLMTSTTFARTFKEVDAVITRGAGQARRFFDTHFSFTQDIYNLSPGTGGSVRFRIKPRHPAVIKFSHADLEQKARTIIDRMEAVKKDGMTVMFYSGIVGSLPGRIATAKQIMSTFIAHLNAKMARIFIINPSEHYEAGMDADDLMYFWEIVQRSGRIDIWRFQTADDITRAFELMGRKVPPEWVGKDATYSTGCTKEMAIAIDVQRNHPEMQIIGPSREQFIRRREYGVGRMFDQRLSGETPPRDR